MKKRIILSLLLLFAVLAGRAQSGSHLTVEKFKDYYKANLTDSIYTLFTPEMQTALKLEGTRALVTQVKSQLGEIVKSREVPPPIPGVSEYRLSFEKALVDMALIIKDNLIGGMQQRAVETNKNDPTTLASPDNYAANNQNGTLYGTLALPKAEGKVPVVLMIAGSGPTDRNMNQAQALKSNSFLMLAKALAANGIASLRYDKRGVGKSSAAHQSSELTLDDFIGDAQLFIDKLKADPKFSRVIVLGHSEGATIGLMASLASHPDAYISLSGVGSDLAAVVKKQFKSAVSAEDSKIAAEILDSLKAGKIVKRNLPPALSGIFAPGNQTFLMSSMKYNPSREIAKLKIPMLIVGGSTDLQVAPRRSSITCKRQS